MKRISFKRLFIATCLSLILAACSSGDNQVAGIGGTGITSSGTVTGFGSIFVNGVEFETTGASINLDDNTSASEAELALGMVVTVTGEIDGSGNTGLAESVVFDDSIEGPVAVTPTADADGQTKTFTILSQTIVVDKNTTVFEGTSFDTIKVNDVVEVSGFVDSLGKIFAMRLEYKSDFLGSVDVELKGVISNLDNPDLGTFKVGTQKVSYGSGTVYDPLSLENNLADGLFVEVKGTFDGTTIIASKIEKEEEGFGEDVGNVSIEGLITDYVSDANFRVQGQTVDATATNVEFEPKSLMLANGLKVEVKGLIEGGILKATKVKSEDGELKFEASIFQVETNNIIMLSYPAPPLTGGGQQFISVTVNSGTKLEVDGTNTFAAALNALSSGDFVKAEAFDDGTGVLVATELKDEDSGDLKLKGPLDEDATQPLPGSNDGSVKILGVLVKTDASTKFENKNDLPITQGEFFVAAKAGVVVKVTDKKQGNNLGDGVADEIELED